MFSACKQHNETFSVNNSSISPKRRSSDLPQLHNQKTYRSYVFYVIRYIFCIITTPFGGILYHYLFNPNWAWCKNEIVHQILFIYTTLIAVIWTALTFDIIQYMTEYNQYPSSGNITSSLLFIGVIYCILNMIIFCVSRHKLISKQFLFRIGFVVGILGYILGFSLKNLSIFILQSTFFKKHHWAQWLYEALQIIFFILYLWMMSKIRTRLCFADSKLNKNNNLLMNYTIAIDDVMADLRRDTDTTTSVSDKNVVYSTDLFSKLMEIADDEHQSFDDEIETELETELETDDPYKIMHRFYDYIKEIDSDAWLISIGFIWIGIVFISYHHQYSSLTHPQIDENQIIIPHFKEEGPIIYVAVFVSIYIFWYIYCFLCSYFQVHRDRCILVEFADVLSFKRRKSIGSNSKATELQRIKSQNTSLENHDKCSKYCIRFSLQYISSETVYMIMDATCGWCFGWSFVYVILNINSYQNNIGYIYLYSIISALLVTIIFLLRMWSFKRGLKKIKYDSNKKYFNFKNITYSNHCKLFRFLHSNWFWRRVLAIAYVVPMEQMLDKTMEQNFDKKEETILAKLIMTIVLTLIFGITGLWLIGIKASRKSQEYLIRRFLKGYPVKLHDLIENYN